MKKILFVCTANICRSPMAAGIFNALAEQKGLEASAESAGVAALVSEPVDPHAHQVTQELGLDLGDHRARQVDLDMVREADLVLTMSSRHRDTLRRDFDGYSDRVYTLPEYVMSDASGGIPDPYGRSLSTYRASSREILDYVERVIDRLKREEKRSEPGQIPSEGRSGPGRRGLRAQSSGRDGVGG